MTVTQTVITAIRDNRDQWLTTRDIANLFPGMNEKKVPHYITPLYHAGVLERELVPGTGRYQYRWLGAGPGGVR